MEDKFGKLLFLLESLDCIKEDTNETIGTTSESNFSRWDYEDVIDLNGIEYDVYANFKWSRVNTGEEHKHPGLYREVYATVPVGIFDIEVFYTNSTTSAQEPETRKDIIEDIKEIVLNNVSNNERYYRDVSYSRWM